MDKSPPSKKSMFKQASKIEKKIALIHAKVRIVTDGVIHRDNFFVVCITIMREVEKHLGPLSLPTKHVIACRLIEMVLTDFGVPSFAATVTAEVIVNMTEEIYRRGYHRFSLTKADRRCALL